MGFALKKPDNVPGKTWPAVRYIQQYTRNNSRPHKLTHSFADCHWILRSLWWCSFWLCQSYLDGIDPRNKLIVVGHRNYQWYSGDAILAR